MYSNKCPYSYKHTVFRIHTFHTQYEAIYKPYIIRLIYDFILWTKSVNSYPSASRQQPADLDLHCFQKRVFDFEKVICIVHFLV